MGVIVGRARRDRLFFAEAPRPAAAAAAAVAVTVIGHVIVAAPVSVAAHLNGNATVGVIDAVDVQPSGRAVAP